MLIHRHSGDKEADGTIILRRILGKCNVLWREVARSGSGLHPVSDHGNSGSDMMVSANTQLFIPSVHLG